MQKRKLQVFVSSTYLDLIEERQTTVQAILESGHIPAGMELFIAGDESQWEIIKEWIDESDIYMLIIGGRYGSIEPNSNKSYTQLEYEYAISVNKPHFVIIIDDDATQKKAKKDGVAITDFFDNSSLLKEFKDSIMKGKLVSICENSDKIESSIHKTINKLSQRDNLKGWVKADDTDYSSISEELARLSKENSELKLELQNNKAVEKINGIRIEEFASFLKKIQVSVNFQFKGKQIDNLLFYLLAFLDNDDEVSRYLFHNYKEEYFKLEKYGLLEEGKLTSDGKKILVFTEVNPYLFDY